MATAREWAEAAPLAARQEARALAVSLVAAQVAGLAGLGPALAGALEQVPGPVLAQALAELVPLAGAPARVLAKVLEPERPVASVQELEQAGALVRALAEAQARALRAERLDLEYPEPEGQSADPDQLEQEVRRAAAEPRNREG